MADAYWLTKQDQEILLELAQEARRRRAAPLGRKTDTGVDDNDHPAPETYVALTPAGGIPARVGTKAGRAVCQIYRLLPFDDPTSTTLTSIPTLTKPVHNLSLTPVPASEWVLVHRDKFGSWLVSGVGSGNPDPSTCGPGCGWLASLMAGSDCPDWSGSCLLFEGLTSTGACNCVDTDQQIYLRYSVVEGKWIGDKPYYVCDLPGSVPSPYTVLFDPDGCSGPCLQLRSGFTEPTGTGGPILTGTGGSGPPFVSCSASPPPNTPSTVYGFPQTINFLCAASGGSGSYSYLWTFEDHTTSTVQNPTHTTGTGCGGFYYTVVVTDLITSNVVSCSVGPYYIG